MLDLPTIMYFLAIVGGTAILGGAIGYAWLRWRTRTPAERGAAEQGAHELYGRDGREIRR